MVFSFIKLINSGAFQKLENAIYVAKEIRLD